MSFSYSIEELIGRIWWFWYFGSDVARPLLILDVEPLGPCFQKVIFLSDDGFVCAANMPDHHFKAMLNNERHKTWENVVAWNESLEDLRELMRAKKTQ